MSLARRWAGPFAGATAVLGSVVGFVIVGTSTQQVPVPAAAEIHAAAAHDDEPSGSATPSPPFTVVYPKRSVDVVEVPGADDDKGRLETGDSGTGDYPPPQSTTSSTNQRLGGNGDNHGQPTVQVTPTPTRSQGEADDSYDSRPSPTPYPTPYPTTTRSPRPSWTPTGSPTQTSSPRPSWSDDDERDRTTTPGP